MALIKLNRPDEHENKSLEKIIFWTLKEFLKILVNCLIIFLKKLAFDM